METWKKINDYQNYEVSNFGEVRNTKTGKVIISNYMKGYKQIKLYKQGKFKHHLVHRLVAEAFLSNPESKTCVNHIDGKKDNNILENLEWATTKENSHHYIKLNYKRKAIIRDSFGNIIQEIDLHGKSFEIVSEKI